MRARRRPSLSAILVIGLCLLWAALALAAGAMPARGGSGHTVEIVDFAFAPAELTISAGDTVTFTNLDAVAHTATAIDGSWDTGLLDQNQSASITFTAAGTYDYLCTPHPSMTGRIVVVAASQPGGGSLPDVAMPRPSPSPMVLLGLALLGLAGLLAVVQHRAGQR